MVYLFFWVWNSCCFWLAFQETMWSCAQNLLSYVAKPDWFLVKHVDLNLQTWSFIIKTCLSKRKETWKLFPAACLNEDGSNFGFSKTLLLSHKNLKSQLLIENWVHHMNDIAVNYNNFIVTNLHDGKTWFWCNQDGQVE